RRGHAIGELPGDLVAAGVDRQVEPRRRRPLAGLAACEPRDVEAERGEGGSEVPPRPDPAAEQQARIQTLVGGIAELNLVLSRPVDGAIEAPPLPRLLVEQAQAG